MNFLTSLISVGMLVALATPGYILQKSKMLPENASKVLVIVLMYIANPFLVFSTFIKSQSNKETLINMGWVALFSFILLLGLFFIVKLCFSAFTDSQKKRVCMTCSFMSNSAFMGIPVLLAFFPDNPETILYCAVFIAIFNMIAWTLTVYVITGEKKYISVKKAFLNPPTIAVALALPFFFAGVNLGDKVMSSIDYLGNMTTPLAMIVMGVRLGGIKIKELVNDKLIYVTASLKLLIVPLLTFGILMLIRLMIPLNDYIIITLYVIMAMPSAASQISFAEMFSSEGATAGKCVLLTSIISIFTIPVLMLLLNYI